MKIKLKYQQKSTYLADFDHCVLIGLLTRPFLCVSWMDFDDYNYTTSPLIKISLPIHYIFKISKHSNQNDEQKEVWNKLLIFEFQSGNRLCTDVRYYLNIAYMYRTLLVPSLCSLYSCVVMILNSHFCHNHSCFFLWTTEESLVLTYCHFCHFFAHENKEKPIIVNVRSLRTYNLKCIACVSVCLCWSEDVSRSMGTLKM